MEQDFIVTNFAYGTGPYLRTTELALAFNDELEARGQARMKIIVPLVYGSKQKKIMSEEFTAQYKKHPQEIIFDEKLGKILRKIFYGNNTYEEALTNWIRNYKKCSKDASEHLKKTYGNGIKVELARSPRIGYSVAPAYFTSFVYIADMMKRALNNKKIKIPAKLLRDAAKIADRIESRYKIHAIAYPATFSYEKKYKPRYKDEILTPPLISAPNFRNKKLKKGILVTHTGIPGLERLYRSANDFGLKLYSNESIKYIISKNIPLQFARSGWGSVWVSMLSSTALLTPSFDTKDDPEIYFNNIAVEKLNLGFIYKGEPMSEILTKKQLIERSYADMKKQILRRWGTLDGIKYAAKLFVDDFVS